MSTEATPAKEPELTPAERAKRRQRLAEVFGDALPEQTSDDLSPEGSDVAATEDWLRRQVPPHHG